MRNHGVSVVVCCMLMFSRDVSGWGEDVLVMYGCDNDIDELILTLSSCVMRFCFSRSLPVFSCCGVTGIYAPARGGVQWAPRPRGSAGGKRSRDRC